MSEVRVRFAPSPTGALHIGGVRTALYNFLFARQQGGKMILRIEDTDQARLIPGAEEYIKEALAWTNIQFDESPDLGGPFAPYRQSERKNIYRQYALDLIQRDHAYYAFDTPEELEAMRERLGAAGITQPQYNSVTRMQMRNSLTLSREEVKDLLDAGAPHVIRHSVPRKEEVRLNDLVRGWVMVHSAQIDDKVLMKSDGMPTYHLANVVDDYLMKITHVIRGEEWLPSAPLHVLLYKHLGWEADMPRFAHLPLLLRPDGNGKLSKRDADQMGFPIFPIDWIDSKSGDKAIGFREAGYLPEALINFLAFLGWNPGTEQELFSLPELIRDFSIDRIGKAGAKFDILKAQWYNQQYLRLKTDSELANYLIASLAKENITCPQHKAVVIAGMMRDRITFPDDIWKLGQYFFIPPSGFDQKLASKKWTEEAVKVLSSFSEAIESADLFDASAAKQSLEEATGQSGINAGKIMQAMRLAITGVGGGPDLMKIMEIIGKNEVQRRIAFALKTLKVKVA
jgi:glutamyl-tRNA synthetase